MEGINKFDDALWVIQLGKYVVGGVLEFIGASGPWSDMACS